MKRHFRLRLSLLLFIAVIICLFPVGALAKTIKEQMEETANEIGTIKEQIEENEENLEELKEEHTTLAGELNSLNQNLTQVSENLNDLEEQIRQKEDEIATTTESLRVASENEESQYMAMKERIKFLYERSDYVYMEMLLSAASFADFLNCSDYITQITEYDKEKLTEYKEVKESIEVLKAQLESEKAELDNLKVQVEAEKSRVSGLVSQTRNVMSAYSNQISEAEEAALAYEAELQAKENDYQTLKKKYEEELRLSQLSANSVKRDISEVTFAEGDRYLLASLIYCEAGGESYEGKLAVGAVVVNRVLSSVYPDTLVGVIYQNRQFSPVASGRLALVMAEGRATESCYRAADEAMAGMTNVGGCVYFRTPVDGLTGIAIGGHIFY